MVVGSLWTRSCLLYHCKANYRQLTEKPMRNTLIALVPLLLVSLPTISTAMDGSVDGKGLWCPDLRPAYASHRGYWFQNNQVKVKLIEGYRIKTDTEYYEESSTSQILIGGGHVVISRKTLKKGTIQCYLMTSPQQIEQKLQAIIDAKKNRNKI